jgi:hypothetical protein
VRALAQRSAEAAKEIKGLISASAAQVAQGVDLVGATGKALARIVEHVAEIDKVVSGIAGSAQEQSTALHQVNAATHGFRDCNPWQGGGASVSILILIAAPKKGVGNYTRGAPVAGRLLGAPPGRLRLPGGRFGNGRPNGQARRFPD